MGKSHWHSHRHDRAKSEILDLARSYLPVTLVASTDVLYRPIVPSDGHVAATVTPVLCISATMPISPIAVTITTDASGTDAELTARKHDWLIARAQGVCNRGHCHECSPEY